MWGFSSWLCPHHTFCSYGCFVFQEFIDIAEKFMDDVEAQRMVTREAKNQIHKEHSPDTEKNAYLKVINNLKHPNTKSKQVVQHY